MVSESWGSSRFKKPTRRNGHRDPQAVSEARRDLQDLARQSSTARNVIRILKNHQQSCESFDEIDRTSKGII